MSLRFTLRQLEYFVAVGEEGSIARASDRVNVSSPSISAAITQLEAEFGLALFTRRHAQGLALSQAGRQFLAQARSVLAEAQRLSHLGAEIAGTVRGPLTVGCLLTFAQLILPSLRREFEAHHPEVQIRQKELDHAALVEGLRDASLDVALSYDLELPSDLDFLPLRALSPYVLLGEGHPLQHRTSLTLQDLAPHPMVLLDLPRSADYFLGLFERAGLRPKVAERTRDMAVMRALVGNGFGYAIANIRPLSETAPDGRRLIRVPLEGPLQPMRLGLLMPPGARRALTVDAFVRHTEAALSPVPQEKEKVP